MRTIPQSARPGFVSTRAVRAVTGGVLSERFHPRPQSHQRAAHHRANPGTVQHWTPLELPPEVAWTEEDNVTFVEARCTQIMEVVFADADTASLILRVAHGTGFVGKALAQIDEHVVGVIATDVRVQIDRGVLRPLDPQIVAEFIVGGIEKIVLRALDAGRAIDVARIAREIAVLVTSGLLPATTAHLHDRGRLAGPD
jgi:hypothetical protein